MEERPVTTWFRAPFESSFSERAQFEAFTLLVWGFFTVLVTVIAKHWETTHDVSLGFLPAFHLLPWVVGLVEYRRLRKRHGTVQENSANLSVPVCNPLQSLIRVLWGAYSAILFLEIVVVWR